MTMIKKIAVFSVFLLLSGTGFLAFANADTAKSTVAPAVSQEKPAKPLLILRFNRPHVQYKAPVQKIVAKAVSIKPAVSFNVVSLIPAVEDKAAAKALAEHNGNKVVEAIAASGVSSDRIKLVLDEASAPEMNEVHIVAY